MYYLPPSLSLNTSKNSATQFQQPNHTELNGFSLIHFEILFRCNTYVQLLIDIVINILV